MKAIRLHTQYLQDKIVQAQVLDFRYQNAAPTLSNSEHWTTLVFNDIKQRADRSILKNNKI